MAKHRKTFSVTWYLHHSSFVLSSVDKAGITPTQSSSEGLVKSDLDSGPTYWVGQKKEATFIAYIFKIAAIDMYDIQHTKGAFCLEYICQLHFHPSTSFSSIMQNKMPPPGEWETINFPYGN